MKRLVGLGLLALSAVAWAQEAATVDLDAVAAPLPKVLKDLSDQTGISFDSRPSMHRDVLGLRLEDATVEEAMSAIATAVHGRWERNGNTVLLSRDSSALNADRAARQTRFQEQLTKQYERFQGMLDQTPGQIPNENMTPQQQMEAARRMMSSNPGSKLVIRLLMTVGQRNIADLTAGERRVFANRPTAMQENLSVNLQQLVRQHLDELGTAGQNQEVGRFMGMGTDADALRQGRAARAFLIVHRLDGGAFMSATAMVTDNDGNVLAMGMMPLDLGNMIDNVMLPGNNQNTPAEPTDPLEIPQEAQEALSLFASNAPAGLAGMVAREVSVAVTVSATGSAAAPMVFGLPEGANTPIEEKWGNILSKPDEFEPLGLFAGPIIRQYAGDREYVAWIPDAAFSAMANQFTRGQVTRSGLERMWTRENSVFEQAQAEGPWILRPRDSAQAADGAIDRGSFAKILVDVRDKGYLRLNAIANYAEDAPVNQEASRLDVTIASRLDAFCGQQIGDIYGPNRMAYAMWNRLGANQRPSPNNPTTLGGNSVAGDARENLYWETFNSMDGPQVVLPQQPGQQQRQEQIVVAGQGGMRFQFGNQNMRSERTEALPRGINSIQAVNLGANRQSTVKARSANGASRVGTMDMFGRMKALNEMMATMTDGRRAGNTAEFTEFTAGETTYYTFTFVLAPNVSLNRTIVDYDFGANRPVPFNQLSATLQEEYRKAYDEMKTQIANGNFRFGGGGNGQQRQGP